MARLDRVDKAELHCHSDGVLDRRMLEDLAAEGFALPITREAFAHLCPVMDKADWIGRYAAAVEPLLVPGDVWQSRLVAQYVRRAAEQGAGYLEIMVSGLLFPRDKGPRRAIDAYRLLRLEADKAAGGRLQVEFLSPIVRGPAERAGLQARRALELSKEGLIRGIFMAGEESDSTVASIKDILAGLKDSGLGIEIHAGEWCGPESVWDALENGKPDRLGHAIAAFRDEKLLERILKDDVHVEFCPTSNRVFGALAPGQEHPLARARELGMNFSINTDDPGPLNCGLNGEFRLAEDAGFTADDFEKVFANAMRSGFADGARDNRRRAGP
ncbi:MAG: hypothetical protein HZB91_04205 [Elusimicrobia bacterium]|nr:hypothetical protein [Elusimicrobiota bacterium]